MKIAEIFSLGYGGGYGGHGYGGHGYRSHRYGGGYRYGGYSGGFFGRRNRELLDISIL
ncbi:MAG: hypothetical protein WCF33_03810 [Pseudonocardiaceae bacterium]